MIIVYRPEGGDEQRWNLNDEKLMAAEAEAVERVTRTEWGELQGKLAKGSMLAMRAFAWVLAKREQPTLRYSEFIPAADELDLDFDPTERAELRHEVNRAADAGEIDEGERAATLAALADPEDFQDAEAAPEPDEGVEGGAVPKDSDAEASPTADVNTAGTLPTS